MKATLIALALAASGFAFSRSAHANIGDLCPLSDIALGCSGGAGTCVAATCCDDPSGCVVSGTGSTGSTGTNGTGSTGTGGGGTGTSYACAVCEAVVGTYCTPEQVGLACTAGGVCTFEGGGGGPATLPGGGTTNLYFDLQVCDTGTAADDGGSANSGTTGGGTSAGNGGIGTSGSSGGTATGGGASATGTTPGDITGTGGANGGITGGTGTGSTSEGATASTGSSGGTAGTGTADADGGTTTGEGDQAGAGAGCNVGRTPRAGDAQHDDVGWNGGASSTSLLIGLALVSSLRRRRRV